MSEQTALGATLMNVNTVTERLNRLKDKTRISATGDAAQAPRQ